MLMPEIMANAKLTKTRRISMSSLLFFESAVYLARTACPGLKSMQLRKVAWLNIYQPRNDAKNPLHAESGCFGAEGICSSCQTRAEETLLALPSSQPPLSRHTQLNHFIRILTEHRDPLFSELFEDA